MKVAKKLYHFHSVPRVEKFLCCISKRLGCIIIGVTYLFFILEAFVSTISSTNLKCYTKGLVQQIVSSVTLIMWLLSFGATLLFLYGITKDQPIFFLFFMYTTVLVIVFNMIHSFMMFFYCYKVISCPTPYLFGGANFFGAVVLIYFLVIVNSHFMETVDKQNLVLAAAAETSRFPSLVASVVPSATASVNKPPAKTSWF